MFEMSFLKSLNVNGLIFFIICLHSFHFINYLLQPLYCFLLVIDSFIIPRGIFEVSFSFQTLFSIHSNGCFSLFLCCLWKADQRVLLNVVEYRILLQLAVYLSYVTKCPVKAKCNCPGKSNVFINHEENF